MANNPHLFRNPHFLGPSPEDAGAATVLIHGRNQGPAEMFALAKRLDLHDMPYIALQAADSSWYPNRFMAPFEDNQPWLDFALASLDHLIAALERGKVQREKIVLLGFSQGACLACEYVYRNPHAYGGLIALTGGLIGPPGTTWPIPTGLASTSVLMTNGDMDEWVPLQRTSETAQVFTEMGADVQLKVFPGRTHEINDEEIDLIRPRLQRLIMPQKYIA